MKKKADNKAKYTREEIKALVEAKQAEKKAEALEERKSSGSDYSLDVLSRYHIEGINKWLKELEEFNLGDCEKPGRDVLGIIERYLKISPVIIYPGWTFNEEISDKQISEFKGDLNDERSLLGFCLGGETKREKSEYYDNWADFFSKVHRCVLLTAALSKEVGAKNASLQFVGCLHILEKLKKNWSLSLSDEEVEKFTSLLDLAYETLWREVEYQNLPTLESLTKKG